MAENTHSVTQGGTTSDTTASPRAGLTSRTLGGLAWGISGTGATAVLQVLVTAVLARLLLPSEFGLLSAASVVIGFSSMFSQLGIGPAIVQRQVLDDEHIRTGFTLSLILAFLLAILVFMATPLIAIFMRLPDLAPVLRVMAAIFPIQAISSVAHSLAQRKLRFRMLVRIDVLSYGLGYGLVGIALAISGFGVWALVAAHVVQATFKTVMLLIAQRHPKGFQFDRVALKELLSFGGGVTFARMANYIAIQGDNLIVGRSLGADALGIHGRAHQISVMPTTLLGQTLDAVLFPAMAEAQGRPESLAVAFRRGIMLISALIAPISMILFVLAPEIILMILGSNWISMVVPLRVLAIGMLFRTSYKMSDCLARATGAVYNSAWRQVVYAILIVIGVWLGARWGLGGVAIAVTVAICAKYVLMAELSLRLLPLGWGGFVRAHMPGLLIGGGVGVQVFVVAALTRYLGFAPFLVLLLSLIWVTIIALLFVLCVPFSLLGTEILWAVRMLLDYIPRRWRIARWLNSRLDNAM